MSRLKIIPGKDVNNDPNDPNDTTDLSFIIQDDGRVSGYGMPVTKGLCIQMINDHYALQSEVFAALNELPPSVKTDELKEKVNPDTAIVAGIYGRDAFMHILEQEGCEGIMYSCCVYGGKSSIVLMGVDKDGKPIISNNGLKIEGGGQANDVIYEVKQGGQTSPQIIATISG